MVGRFRKFCVILVSVLLVAGVTVLSCSVMPVEGYASESANTQFLSGSQDDLLYSVAQAGDDGFVSAGYTKSYGAGGSDMWLVKSAPYTTSLEGISIPWTYDIEQWNMTFGGPDDDGAKCVVQTVDSGYALAGYTNSWGEGGSDMWLVKTDENGVAEWNMTYGGLQDDAANCVVQMSDGGYVLAGYTNSFDISSQSSWLVKTDADGNMDWNEIYSGQAVNSLSKTSDGGFALATANSNAFGLVKIDDFGRVQWSKTFAGACDYANGECMIQTTDGGYAIAGWTLTSSTGLYASWLVKTDFVGTVQWSQTYGSLGVYSVVQTSDGGYAMTGDRACLIIADSAGNFQWSRNYDGLSEDSLYSIRTYSIIEPSPNMFRMVGVQEDGSVSPSRYDAISLKVKLRTDSTSPVILVLSPENNKSYDPDSVQLVFTVNKPTVWVGYCLDNGLNVTISGNTTLPTLTDGPHNITVFASDTSYNAGASEIVQFSSGTIYFTISQGAVLVTPVPSSTPTLSDTEPFPATLVTVSIAAVAVAGVGLLFYFTKHKK
jgi:hypothetical protein